VPALRLDLSGPRYLWCFSDVLRHQSEVLCVLWTVVMLSIPRYYTCRWINVSPSMLSMLSDVCQTVHSVGSFHLPFRLPFLLPFALSSALSSALSLSFPFLSYPPLDLGGNYF
jgi:hypothetical protein